MCLLCVCVCVYYRVPQRSRLCWHAVFYCLFICYDFCGYDSVQWKIASIAKCVIRNIKNRPKCTTIQFAYKWVFSVSRAPHSIIQPLKFSFQSTTSALKLSTTTTIDHIFGGVFNDQTIVNWTVSMIWLASNLFDFTAHAGNKSSVSSLLNINAIDNRCENKFLLKFILMKNVHSKISKCELKENFLSRQLHTHFHALVRNSFATSWSNKK